MITWRKIYDRRLCIFRIKKDFILTGQRSTSKEIDFSLSDSEYEDDTAVLFDSRESLETSSPQSINHFEKFRMEIHVGHCDLPKFCLFQLHHLLMLKLQLLTTNIYSLSTLAIAVPTSSNKIQLFRYNLEY